MRKVRLFGLVCLMFVALASSYSQTSIYRDKVIGGTILKGNPSASDTVISKPEVQALIGDSSIYVPNEVSQKLAFWLHQDTLSFIIIGDEFELKDGGANPDTLSTGVKTLPLGVQMLDSLATSDTLSMGECDGATIDTIYYNMATGGSVTFRLELVDSLYQTSGVTLVDTTTVTTMRVKQYSTNINNAVLTNGKLLRVVFPAVNTEPKGFAIGIKGSY